MVVVYVIQNGNAANAAAQLNRAACAHDIAHSVIVFLRPRSLHIDVERDKENVTT